MRRSLILAIAWLMWLHAASIAIEHAPVNGPTVEIREALDGGPGRQLIEIRAEGVSLKFVNVSPTGLYLGRKSRVANYPEEAQVFYTPASEYWIATTEMDVHSWNAFSSRKQSSPREGFPASGMNLADAEEWANNFNTWMVRSGHRYLASIPAEDEWEHAFNFIMLSGERNPSFDAPIGADVLSQYFNPIGDYAVLFKDGDAEPVSFDIKFVMPSATKRPIGLVYDAIGNLEELTRFERRGDEEWNILVTKSGERLSRDVVLKGGCATSPENRLFPSSRYFRQSSLRCPETGLRIILKKM